MQSDVMITDQMENAERDAEIPLFLLFLNQFVPESTEVML
jgi:hypothetical protein